MKKTIRLAVFDIAGTTIKDNSTVAAAFQQASQEGGLARLEPLVTVGISVPRDDVRALVNDVAACRGHEVRRALTPKGIVVEVHLPLSSALTYSERLKKLTEGRAWLISTPEFAGYTDASQ